MINLNTWMCLVILSLSANNAIAIDSYWATTELSAELSLESSELYDFINELTCDKNNNNCLLEDGLFFSTFAPTVIPTAIVLSPFWVTTIIEDTLKNLEKKNKLVLAATTTRVAAGSSVDSSEVIDGITHLRSIGLFNESQVNNEVANELLVLYRAALQADLAQY